MRELVVAAVILLVALLLGLLLGAVGWALFIGLALWVGIQLLEFRKIERWSRRPLSRPANGYDTWFELAYRPFRSLQAERARTRATLMRFRDVLTLIQGIPDGVVIQTGDGDIEAFNAAAKEILELGDGDVGLSLSTVVRSPDFVEFLRSEPSDEPLEFVSPFDSERTLEARRFDVETGRTIVVVRDITRLNRLLTMRQNFIANVSHELRTPLTVVNGYLETMLDDSEPQAFRLDLAHKLPRPLQRMQALVDDLLLLTTLESTEATPDLDVVSLPRVIDGAIVEVQGLQSTPGQIVADVQSDRNILGIETELQSVCVNLLSNALRYSPEGSTVTVRWSDVADKVRLAVEDTGVGIAPEHIDRLTERFYRVDLAGARSRGGTGLGLAIVKHALRRHGSELQVDSTLGAGSTFYCDFDPAPEALRSPNNPNESDS